MHLPAGTLKRLEAITGIAAPRLCDYAATRVRPRPKRAEVLEKACKNIGITCPAATWLLGSSAEIKRSLIGDPAEKRKAERRHDEHRSMERGSEDRRCNPDRRRN